MAKPHLNKQATNGVAVHIETGELRLFSKLQARYAERGHQTSWLPVTVDLTLQLLLDGFEHDAAAETATVGRTDDLWTTLLCSDDHYVIADAGAGDIQRARW